MSTATPPPLRLLIVDDDEALRQLLARRFQRLGMSVAEAADGEEALAKAGNAAFDVALLDLHMPGMTGIELLGRLKALWRIVRKPPQASMGK
jgi:CheY-like chemotaxis protein